MRPPLLFCTSYIEDESAWRFRFQKWLVHHETLFPDATIAFIDDASPFLPSEAGIAVNVINNPSSSFDLGIRASIFTFPDRFGRRSLTDFPGWFRSFTYSVEIARTLGASKIIHIESDAFVLSSRARELIERLEEGWTAFWCPRWRFAETAIQIICADQFAALERVRATNYESNLARKFMEDTLPFTNIEKNLRGDRYSDYWFRRGVPRRADFAAQVGASVKLQSLAFRRS